MRPTLEVTESGGILRFLYRNPLGRGVLKILTLPFLSKICGKYMDSAISRHRIAGFVKKNNIDLSVYQEESWRSFNAFFSRRIRPEVRPLGNADTGVLISPCDAKLSVYSISDGLVMPIKESAYTVTSLLKNENLAKQFRNGYALVFRLTVDDYHRYCYPLSGTKECDIYIPGILHTVRPIALLSCPVFCENSRSYTLIHSNHFGDVLQMEVGALLVGKIVNHHTNDGIVNAGEEKGYFAFGGSTIVLLFQEGSVILDTELIENSKQGLETVVRYGESLGSCTTDQNINYSEELFHGSVFY